MIVTPAPELRPSPGRLAGVSGAAEGAFETLRAQRVYNGLYKGCALRMHTGSTRDRPRSATIRRPYRRRGKGGGLKAEECRMKDEDHDRVNPRHGSGSGSFHIVFKVRRTAPHPVPLPIGSEVRTPRPSDALCSPEPSRRERRHSCRHLETRAPSRQECRRSRRFMERVSAGRVRGWFGHRRSSSSQVERKLESDTPVKAVAQQVPGVNLAPGAFRGRAAGSRDDRWFAASGNIGARRSQRLSRRSIAPGYGTGSLRAMPTPKQNPTTCQHHSITPSGHKGVDTCARFRIISSARGKAARNLPPASSPRKENRGTRISCGCARRERNCTVCGSGSAGRVFCGSHQPARHDRQLQGLVSPNSRARRPSGRR